MTASSSLSPQRPRPCTSVALWGLRGRLGRADIFAVLIAAFIVKSLPLDTLRWLVIVVILYTAGVMLRAGFK